MEKLKSAYIFFLAFLLKLQFQAETYLETTYGFYSNSEYKSGIRIIKIYFKSHTIPEKVRRTF